MTTTARQHDYPTVIAEGGPLARAAWDEFVADENLRPSTRKNYRNQAARFLRGLERRGISLSQITPAVVLSYLDRQKSSHEKYLCRVPLRGLFDSLVRQGALTTNPAERPQLAAGEPGSEHEISPSNTCRRCGQQKPLDEFRIGHRWKGGRLSICRVCESTARRAGRVRYLGNEARTRLAPASDSQPLSPKDLHHKMVMLIVYGFGTEEQFLAKYHGKDSPQYKSEMAKVWIALEKLFALLREAAPSLAGRTGRENPVTTAPNR